MIDLFIGLLISEGFIARSVIRIPYTNPIASEGPNIIFNKRGDSSLRLEICGWKTKNKINALTAAIKKINKFRCLIPLDSDKSYSLLNTVIHLKKWIKEIIKKHLFK